MIFVSSHPNRVSGSTGIVRCGLWMCLDVILNIDFQDNNRIT